MSIKEQIRAEIERQINSLPKDWTGASAARWAFDEILKFLDTIPEQPVKNPCSFYSEGYGCEISPMKNCIGCEHNRWGLGTKVAKKQPVTTITKSNALFDKCVENCDPAVMKEVSDNVDKMLGKQPASDDEQTRKDIIAFILNRAGYLLDENTEHRFIAYLEKQKEK